ncbi:MAG TPA: helix-turn-helix transcriptional regulator [Kineosporiaceae bacterium]|nr:helix-turn-helix transcriptional regulator [Kineosporiaceae bacterium]
MTDLEISGRLRYWRRRREMTQSQLSEKVFVDRSQLSRIESGKRPLSLERARRLDLVLDTRGDLERLVASSAETVPESIASGSLNDLDDLGGPRRSSAEVTSFVYPVEEGSHILVQIRRRLMLQGALAAAALPVLRLDELNHLIAALTNARVNADLGNVDQLRRTLSECARKDGLLGPHEALPSTLGLIGAIDELAKEATPRARKGFLLLGSETAEFLGWLYRDSGVYYASEYWRDRAMEWAQEAGNPALEGYILLKKSQTAWDLRQASRMLNLADAAEEKGALLPPRLRAEILQQQARGQAMLSRKGDLFRQKLDEALNLIRSTSDDNQGSPFGAHYNATVLALQSAICFMEAGIPGTAIEIYGRMLSKETLSVRDQGYFTALLSAAFAADGDPDAAASAAAMALEIGIHTQSRRTISEVKNTSIRLRPWMKRSSVQELVMALEEQVTKP